MRSLKIWLVPALVISASLSVVANPLPPEDGRIEIPAQPRDGAALERMLPVYLRYPGGELARVKPSTGVMLSLHNWGGTEFSGAPDPAILTEQLDCIVVGVDYFQSGSEFADLPYDFGWLQALDALRALHYVVSSLEEMRIPFAKDRIFAVGGSGGGNVSLMANKLAPRTFAAVVDISGMKELSDDMAFNLDGGSNLDARYSSDPTSPARLTDDDRELRRLGNPEHLRTMKGLGSKAKIFSVHGEADGSCLFSEALSYARDMKASGLDFVFVPVTADVVDGEVFKDTGHSLGDRTDILLHVAEDYLRPDGRKALRRQGPSDFDRKDAVRYRTASGEWVVDYSLGYPVGRFEPSNGDASRRSP